MSFAGEFKPFVAATPKSGTLVEWDTGKAFGYLECEGKRVFLHVKEFERRPHGLSVGDEVRFTAGQDVQGRPCAKAAMVVRQRARPIRFGVGRTAVLLGLLVLPVLALMVSGLPPLFLAAYPTGISLLTFLLYHHDKRQARSGGWRTPESTLHLCELLGGWAAAYLAQHLFRHKTIKGSYRVVFWMIVIAHQVAAADYLAGGQLSRRLMERLGPLVRAMSA
jgi:uncharacterized membrane protein YsdA (DUF1294 family)/cold shock CspA family protein